MTTQSLSGTSIKVLQAFSRALRRESHVLTQHPKLLWQQLYNRLQWQEDVVKQVIEAEKGKRAVIGALPWLLGSSVRILKRQMGT
jgi:hypothetical protein